MSSIREGQAQQLCSKQGQASEPLEVPHTGDIAGTSVHFHLSKKSYSERGIWPSLDRRPGVDKYHQGCVHIATIRLGAMCLWARFYARRVPAVIPLPPYTDRYGRWHIVSADSHQSAGTALACTTPNFFQQLLLRRLTGGVVDLCSHVYRGRHAAFSISVRKSPLRLQHSHERPGCTWRRQ